jgi:hypothetical protein
MKAELERSMAQMRMRHVFTRGRSKFPALSANPPRKVPSPNNQQQNVTDAVERNMS